MRELSCDPQGSSGNPSIRSGASPAHTVGNVIGSYKSRVAVRVLNIYKKANRQMGKLWHRNYYEHIIRNERELNLISQYIELNPSNWDDDIYNPKRDNNSVKEELSLILSEKKDRQPS